MRIGILSDSHNQKARTARAVALLASRGAETLIHCGDLTDPAIVHECAVLPSAFVLGNNDFDEIGLRTAIEAIGGTFLGRGGLLTLDGKRIAVTHGDLAAESRRLLALNPDYFLYGHTHTPHDGEGTPRWINPGALHRASQYTVALLDLADDQLEFLGVP